MVTTVYDNLVYPSQVKASAEELIKKESKTTQPTLWCSLDKDGFLNQAFVVVDKAVLLKFPMLLKCSLGINRSICYFEIKL